MALRAIIFSCLILPILAFGQNESLPFKHISLEQGLSQSSVTCILKDSKGFMWFGTEDGLNKFDGNDFTAYRHIPGDNQSLSDSAINIVIEDKDGFLWIGTKNGLNHYDPNSETFKRYKYDEEDTSNLSNNQIFSLLIDSNGNLLVGTSDGLRTFNPKIGFKRLLSKTSNNNDPIFSIKQDKHNYIWLLSTENLTQIKLNNEGFYQTHFQKSLDKSFKYTMHIDASNLWVGTSKGLVKYNLESQLLKTFTFYESDGMEEKRNMVLSIIENKSDSLLLGTLEGGLVSFNTSNNDYRITTYNPDNNSGLNSNSIKSLFIDESDILWIGTYGRGINKYDPNQFKFKHYKYAPNNKNSLSESTVRSVLRDNDGDMWVGTHDGLNRVNRESNSFTVYRHEKNNQSTISSNTVRSLKQDSDGTIWAGTWSHGLNSFNKNEGLFKRYTSYYNGKKLIGPVRALEIDKQDNIWIGGNGLLRLDPNKNKYKVHLKSNKYNDNVIHSLYLDKNESLWIGTYQNGIIKLNTKTGKTQTFSNNPKDSLSVSHNYITSIAEDLNGYLWIGTYGGGLNKLDTSSGLFKRYNTSNGLLNDVVYGVITDDKNNVWFTSNAGLSSLDSENANFTHYDVDYGIQSMEFNSGAYSKGENGEFFFGGINGLNAFYPNDINESNSVSNIVFTEFQFPNKEKIYSSNELYGKNISRLEHIDLNYYQNSFSLKFSELNYANNLDNQYEYQLKGLSDDWLSLDEKRLISIGNLKPGKYILNLRAQGEEIKQTSISLKILPPYWKTLWAYLCYMLIISLVLFKVHNIIKKNKNARELFELKIKNLEENISTITLEKNQKNVNTLTTKNVDELSIDEKFIQRAIEIVENNLTDSSFNVQKFADEIFASKSQLHRKLKKTTGYSTTEFIRLIRLKKASQLLKLNSATISEIAYKVGFDNVGYFSKCFRELFGETPSQHSK